MRIIYILFTIAFTFSYAIAQICPKGGLQIYSQGNIDTFENNYPDCRVIEGSVIFSFGNDALDLTPLNRIKRIKGNLEVYSTKMDMGLDNLAVLDGDFIIASGYGDTVNGLGSLKSIKGHVNIEHLIFTPNLHFLSKIDSIHQGLRIGNMPSITSFKGLDSIKYLGGLELEAIVINHFEGINPNVYIDSFLSITGNVFTDCTFKPFCEFLVNVRGTPFISRNGEGCMHEQLVRMQCLTPTDNYLIQQIDVYPNPATSEVVISAIPHECRQLKLSNTLGQVIDNFNINGSQMQLDVSGINRGFYVLQFEGEEGLMGSRVLVMQ